MKINNASTVIKNFCNGYFKFYQTNLIEEKHQTTMLIYLF